MALVNAYQIEALRDARIGLINVSATGGSTVVTTPLTTALNTAGDGGVSVPLQVASATAPGVVTAVPDNVCIILNSTTKRPIADGSGNEVYGRLTEAAGVYTLTYFTLVSGSQTAFSFGSATGIDIFFPYRFDFGRFPRNAGLQIGGTIIQQDPSISAGANIRNEVLTVTALNTLSALSQAPSAPTNIYLHVNGVTEDALSGGAFSVSGTAITWNATNAKYSLQTTFRVIAFYW